MIDNKIIIDIKGTSDKDKDLIIAILLNNYKELLLSIKNEADYCDTTGYWKDIIPIGTPITKAKDFIAAHSDDIPIKL